MFAGFTYIAPILTRVTGFLGARRCRRSCWCSVRALVVGNLVGGKLADRRLVPTMLGSLIALSVVSVGADLRDP